jgi:hypothetical protein
MAYFSNKTGKEQVSADVKRKRDELSIFRNSLPSHLTSDQKASLVKQKKAQLGL